MKRDQAITSDSRMRIEAVLKAATQALGAQEISDLSGVSISITRTHLGNAIHKGRAHNISPKRNSSAYLWGSGLPEVVMPEPRSAFAREDYKPAPIHTRAGSDAFLKAPSRTGETLTQYRPPISMCGEQVSRV